ncbi:MAG: hypothetical protein ACXVCP_12180 [Bdellovibrio sp.]
MLRLIFLLSVCLNPLTFVARVYAASEPLAFTSDITYSHNFKKQYDKYPEAIDKAIEHFAFSKLVGNGRFLTVNYLDQMNRIYIPKQYGVFTDQRLILAKSGFEITGAVKYGEIYEASAGYIVHFKTKQAGDVALFFKGFSVDRIQKIKNEIVNLLNVSPKSQSENSINSKSQSFRVASVNSIQNLFFPLAYAQDAHENSESLCSNSFSTSSGKGMDASALEQLWGCTKGFAGGVWDSSLGVVPFVIKGTYQVIAQPVDTFNRAANEFSKIAGLVTDFENSFGNLTSSLQALPQDVRVKIACEVFGSLLTTGLISFLSSGAGSPLFFKVITQALQKVASALPAGAATTAKVTALANGMEKKAQAAQANLDILKQIDNNKEMAKVYEAEMDLLRPTLKDGRDPENLAALLWDLEKSEEFELLPDADRKEISELLKAGMKQQANDWLNAQAKFDKLKEKRNTAIKFLKNNKVIKLNLKQKAALTSYFAVSGCSHLSSISEAMKNANDKQKGQANQANPQKGTH